MTTGWVRPSADLAARIVAELRRVRGHFDDEPGAQKADRIHAISPFPQGVDWAEAWVDLAHTVRLRGFASMGAADAVLGRAGWLDVIDETIARLCDPDG